MTDQSAPAAPAAPAAAADGPAAPAEPRPSAEAATKIAAGYQFTGPALEFGTVVLDNIAYPEAKIRVPLSMMSRHGLIAGATGTGKTKTLQGLAEQLSAAGVPVVVADIKGDLSGLSQPGATNPKVTQRVTDTADTEWAPTAFPVEFYALGGVGSGIPLRATMTSFGPTLLSKILGLNNTQESSLKLVFHFADKAGLPLLDLKDLRAVIQFLVGDEGKAELAELGGLSSSTAGVILRDLIGLEDQGGDQFFGEPEFETSDLLRTAADGRGIVSAIELANLQDRPQLFSTFLMWLLADLFHELPEVGDVDKPKLVFFFDEAHLLFDGASKVFLEAVTQTVRLIRSKGVGIFFVTQNPTDVPDEVLGQLGNRVQHALRAFTPDDAAALAKAVRTYPKTKDYDLADALQQLGTGEAVITVLSERGAPTPVAWARMRAPRSLMAQIDATAQQQAIAGSPLQAKYGEGIDRESAYEKLAARLATPPAAQAPAAPPQTPQAPPAPKPPAEHKQAPHKDKPSAVESVLKSSAFKSFARSAATVLGREITRGIFGTRKR
ncbi:MAG: double-strand break repair helicase HerA and related ATPase [Pseudonocardiales bacterium]|nr:double-strand break repair helicase HerA and related ATPase [Pseudonocardiales bacterium]